jgi:hypothetical protein
VSNDETVPIITAIALLEDQNGMPQHAQFPVAPSEERHRASQEPEIQFGWWSPSIAPPDPCENASVDYFELREAQVLRGFVYPANQSPLKNFDQLLSGAQINSDIESAPVAQRNPYYVIAVLVRLRKYGGHPICWWHVAFLR